MESAGEDCVGVISSVGGVVSSSVVFSGAGFLIPRMMAAMRTMAPSMEAVMRAVLRIRF